MSEKILVFICFIGICQAIFINPNKNINNEKNGKEESKVWQVMNVYQSPQSHTQYKYEAHAYPKYDFQYAVSDKKTGDHKQHSESRDGDRVRGEYSLVEPDGSIRKVEYNADGHYGFNAIISKGVQKHGDHAISFFDHTRHFYPIGHNVKINHYFPYRGQNSIENISENAKEEKPTPVQEDQEPKKDAVMVLLNARDKLVVLKQVETTELQNKEIESSNLSTEVNPVTISPTIGTIIVPAVAHDKLEVETVPLKSAIEKDEIVVEAEQNPVKDINSDSEVASSYSRMYYMY